MPKYIPTEYNQNILVPVKLSEQIQPGTLEHTIDYVVENKVDISSLEEYYKNDDTGRPAWDPKILLKIVLLAYSRGIIHSRKIEKACQENIVFIAISGWSIPHFTVIADFIQRLEDDIITIFQSVLLICDNLNLLGGTTFALDGCKISSNASKEYSGTFSDFNKKKEKFREKITYLIKKHKNIDKFDENKIEYYKKELDDDVAKKIDKIEKEINKIENYIKSNEPKKGKRGKENKSNITDNESAKMVSCHGMIQGYNGQALVDEKHQVILAAEAFGSGPDNDLFQPMIKSAERNLKAIGKSEYNFKKRIIIADTGYFNEENIKYASDNNIDAYIPDQQFRKRDIKFLTRDRYKTYKSKNKFSIDDFTYDANIDVYKCPAGQLLELDEKDVKIKHYVGDRYACKQRYCSKCKIRDNCITGVKVKKRTIFISKRRNDRNYSKEMIKKIDTPEARDIYSKRMGIVEPVFGNICFQKRLNYFSLRTKNKVNIQWLFYCIVHNLEKITNYGNLTII